MCWRNIKLRIFAILAVLLFFSTLVFPFLSLDPTFLFVPFPEPVPGQKHIDRVDLWSFKMSETISCFKRFDDHFTQSVEDYWFNDYWFRCLTHWIYIINPSMVDKVRWSLIFLFATQIATLTVAITSTFIINKKILYLAPAILCPITTLLMTSIFTRFKTALPEFQLGYWLTYPTEALFIANIMINLLKSKKITKT